MLCGEDLSSQKAQIESLVKPSRDKMFKLWLRKYAKNETLRTYRSFMGNFLNRDEKQILSEIALHSVSMDAIVWFSHRCDPISYWLPKVSKCPVIFYAIDSFARFESTRSDRGFLRNLSTPIVRNYEKSIITSGYSSIVYVSESDARTAQQVISGVQKVPIYVLSNGADTTYFHSKDYSRYSLPSVPTLLYTGLMKSIHNVEAATAIVKQVMPKMKKRVVVRIAGRDPSRKVRSLEKSDGSVTVTGTVSEIAQEYRDADLFVAPIFTGTGFMNKIAEALSCGLPVVTTSLAAGCFLPGCKGIRVTDNHKHMAEVLDYLLENPDEIVRLGKESASYARENFSWDNWEKRLFNIIKETISGAHKENLGKFN